MSTPLLKTKLYVPTPSPNTVVRPRLRKQLDQGLVGKLTLVAAPAGFGKTTLISCWVQNIPQAIAWVSFDEGDNDSSIFWAYVVTAIQQVSAKWEDPLLRGIDPTQLPPTKILLTNLVNQLSGINQQIVLVLDDYHVISTRAIHADLEFLIDHQPSQIHIVLATRADPPIPISRLRAQEQLSEIRVDDLRFSLEEATTYLNKTIELGLTQDDVAALEARTEGWAVGLQLAALSMQGRNDKHKFITDFSGSHYFILEYLTEEVINRLPGALRNFLMLTSVLDQFNASLCDMVVETEGSAFHIATLQRHHIFIVPLDDERIWFRYHHLFRDLLLNRLKKEYTQENIFGLYRLASRWYQQKNEFDVAVKYALLAKDFEVAADLIEQIASSTMLHGRLRTLLNWIVTMPESLLDSRPRLRFYQAWALSLSGQPSVAEQILLDTRTVLDQQPPSPKNIALRGELAALLTSVLTYSNDPPRVIREAKKALADLPEDNQISRARVYIALSTAYAYRDEIDKAIWNYQKAKDLAIQASNPFLATSAMEMRAGMQIFHLGQLHQSVNMLQEILDMGTKPDGSHLPFSGTAQILLAEVYLEWNDLDQATSYIENGFKLLESGGIGYSLPYAFCAKARLMRAFGDQAGAIQALHNSELAIGRTPLLHVMIHQSACQVRLALWLGDVATAKRWAFGDPNTIQYEFPENIPSYLREVQQLATAWVYFAEDDTVKTLEICDQLRSQAESAGRMAHVIEINLLRALAMKAQGDVQASLESLEKCLSGAEPQGYTRLFLEAGPPALKLLRVADSEGIHSEYVGRLLASFGVSQARIQKGTLPAIPSQDLIEPLSQREHEVFKLIIAGSTNQEIADELVVSLNTVKKHTTHIYGKLGVRNRTQAIAKARQLDLIQ